MEVGECKYLQLFLFYVFRQKCGFLSFLKKGVDLMKIVHFGVSELKSYKKSSLKWLMSPIRLE